MRVLRQFLDASGGAFRQAPGRRARSSRAADRAMSAAPWRACRPSASTASAATRASAASLPRALFGAGGDEAAQRSALRLSDPCRRGCASAAASSTPNSSWRRVSSAIRLAAAARRAFHRQSGVFAAIAARRRAAGFALRACRVSSAPRASRVGAARARRRSRCAGFGHAFARRRLPIAQLGQRRFGLGVGSRAPAGDGLFQAADFRLQRRQLRGAFGGGPGGAGVAASSWAAIRAYSVCALRAPRRRGRRRAPYSRRLPWRRTRC